MENSVDFSKFASHELSLQEVKAFRGAKVWGWAGGMFIAGNDDMIALRFMRGADYESVTRELWRRCCRGAELVVDIGTHSGVFSLDAYRAGARLVFSAEPHPINYARLIINLRYNNFPVTGTFYGAIGDENKIGLFLVNSMHFVHAAGQMEGTTQTQQMRFPVMVSRLDSVIDEKHWASIKAIKIDAENYTPNVLEGMSKIFEAGHRPDLIIECTEGGMGERLKALGYNFWRIWETGKVEQVDDLTPHNPDGNYNGTMEACRNRFASVHGLP